jgi:hypothetical protein
MAHEFGRARVGTNQPSSCATGGLRRTLRTRLRARSVGSRVRCRSPPTRATASSMARSVSSRAKPRLSAKSTNGRTNTSRVGTGAFRSETTAGHDGSATRAKRSASVDSHISRTYTREREPRGSRCQCRKDDQREPRRASLARPRFARGSTLRHPSGVSLAASAAGCCKHDETLQRGSGRRRLSLSPRAMVQAAGGSQCSSDAPNEFKAAATRCGSSAIQQWLRWSRRPSRRRVGWRRRCSSLRPAVGLEAGARVPRRGGAGLAPVGSDVRDGRAVESTMH